MGIKTQISLYAQSIKKKHRGGWFSVQRLFIPRKVPFEKKSPFCPQVIQGAYTQRRIVCG